MDLTHQLLITYSAFVTYLKKKNWEYNEAVHQLFVTNKIVCNSVWREVLYDTVGRFVITTKLIKTLKYPLRAPTASDVRQANKPNFQGLSLFLSLGK